MKNQPFKHAVIATDLVLFSFHQGKLLVLLTPTQNRDLKGMLCLPGGLILPKETADDSVMRHAQDKAGVAKVHFEQLYTFSALDRDQRGRVVSVAYLAVVQPEALSDITKEGVVWVDVAKVPKLAYDHNEMIEKGIERLRSKMEYTTIVSGLLPKEFTLTELQDAYETILKKEFDKRNFRKKILALEILQETGEMRGDAHRPAMLYKFAVKYGPVVGMLS